MLGMLLAALALPQGQVLVVDVGGGPGAFPDLQAAVDAAADGDTILVKVSQNGPTSIVAKGLTIVVDPFALPAPIVERLAISALAPSQGVLLRGLTIAGAGNGLLVSNAAGPIWVESCVIAGADGDEFPVQILPGVGATLSGCASVTFVRCSVRGGNGADGNDDGDHGKAGARAISATGSRLALYDTALAGGHGGDAQGTSSEGPVAPQGGAGADALRLDGGELFASGSTLVGGDGGGGDCGIFNCGDGGTGGRGLSLHAGAVSRELTSVFAGGDGGLNGNVGSAPDGVPVFAAAGATHASLTGTARSFVASSPVREGEAAVLRFIGLPGDLALTLYSPEQQPATFLNVLAGVVLPSLLQADGLAFGQLAGDTLLVSLPVPFLAPSLQGVTIHFQALFADASLATFTLGPASAMTILDESF